MGPILIAVAATLLLSMAFVHSQQTRIDPDQVPAPAVAVVEWAECTAPPVKQPGLEVDCASLELYRFRMPDGSLRGPFVAVPVDPARIRPADWTWRPLR